MVGGCDRQADSVGFLKQSLKPAEKPAVLVQPAESLRNGAACEMV